MTNKIDISNKTLSIVKELIRDKDLFEAGSFISQYILGDEEKSSLYNNLQRLHNDNKDEVQNSALELSQNINKILVSNLEEKANILQEIADLLK